MRIICCVLPSKKSWLCNQDVLLTGLRAFLFFRMKLKAVSSDKISPLRSKYQLFIQQLKTTSMSQVFTNECYSFLAPPTYLSLLMPWENLVTYMLCEAWTFSATSSHFSDDSFSQRGIVLSLMAALFGFITLCSGETFLLKPNKWTGIFEIKKIGFDRNQTLDWSVICRLC